MQQLEIFKEEKRRVFYMPDEVVHHINHDSTDNRVVNLCVMTRSNHSKFHSLKRWHGDKAVDHTEFSITS